MRILLINVSFHLPGCQSLKEKRRRLGRIGDKLGKTPQIAVSESGGQNQHQHSTWSFVVVGASSALLDRHCARIETVCMELDAVVSNIDRQWLR